MKALSVRQPWASLIAWQTKTLELRSRPIKYRGELLICASAAFGNDPDAKHALQILDKATLLRGVTLAVVDVVGCRPFVLGDELAACCPYVPGYFAWELVVKRLVAPVPIKGSLGFFNVPDHLLMRAA